MRLLKRTIKEYEFENEKVELIEHELKGFKTRLEASGISIKEVEIFYDDYLKTAFLALKCEL